MHDLSFRFKRAHLQAVALAKKKLRKWKLSPARFDVLYVVQQGRAYGVLQSRIWDTLGLHKSTISKMCKRLEELGFIKRVNAAHTGSDRKRGMRGNGWVGERASRRNEGDDYDPYDDCGRKQGNREISVKFTLEGIIEFKKAMRLVFHSRGWRFVYRVLLSGIMPAADDVDAFIARARRELERIARAFHDTSSLLYPLDSRPGDVMVAQYKARLDLIERVRKNDAEREATYAQNKAAADATRKAESDADDTAAKARALAFREPPADGDGEPIADSDGEAIAEGDGEAIVEGDGEAIAEGAAAHNDDDADPDDDRHED